MALAKDLIPGMEVTVTSGGYVDHTAIIIDNTPVPDGQEHQRKILVALQDVYGDDDQPFQTYILPRMLDFRRSVTMSGSDYLSQEQQAAITTIDHGFMVKASDITDPMDPALDRFRPSSTLVHRYISRVLPGGYTDVDYMLMMREQRDPDGYSPNIALVGDTQSGKTMLVEVLAVLAAERDGMPKPYPVFTINGSSGVTSYDIYGQTTAVVIDGREVLVWMEGLAGLAAKCGGFLYLDEWNAVAPAQAVALHCLLDGRHQFINTQKAVPDGHGGFSPEVVKANPKLWIISTINPGYKGTQTMAEATSNRFRWLPWNYDEATEKALIPSKTVRLLGERLREAARQRVVTVPVGTSVLQRLTADCAMFGVENALWTFTGLFPPNERTRVQELILDGGLYDILLNEYPTPTFRPEDQSGHVAGSVGPTWNPDSIAQQV